MNNLKTMRDKLNGSIPMGVDENEELLQEQWNKHKHSNFAEYEMKPITKEPIMKEFLVKSQDGKWRLETEVVGDPGDDIIEVPEGADSFRVFYVAPKGGEFYKENSTMYFDKNYNQWSGVSRSIETLNTHSRTVWQRETLNDKVASAEVARQEFIGAPFSDLPKFSFEAVDDFVESNVEQDNVNQPSHYNKGGVECIDAIQSSMTHEAFCGYLKGNVQKYMWRYENKGGVESLEKAQWYLNKLIEVRNENSSED